MNQKNLTRSTSPTHYYGKMLFCCLALIVTAAHSQTPDVPLRSPAYEILDEWDVEGEEAIFSTVKPINKQKFADALKTREYSSDYDATYIKRTVRDRLDSLSSSRKPILKYLYQYPEDMYSLHSDDFELHINPVVVLNGGKESSGGDLLFENYRGLEISGIIDRKIGFYTMLTENQARYPLYVRQVTDSTLGVPYEGFWKQYQETGVDFLRAQGYINFGITRHVDASFGYGKHFIGNGRRSMILSDFSNNYPYLRINTQIWKIQYTNIFAQLVAETKGGDFGLFGTAPFPLKFLALHRLEMKFGSRFHLGLFESVVYGAEGKGLKTEYMNPLIFYRSLEQQGGSDDNALLGLDFKYNFLQHFSLYGQFVIDELIISNVFDGTGWWGNKHGYQGGIKYLDALGIEDLDLQLEWNRARPFIYSHEDNYRSYTHYNMALAHPLGANFDEKLFSLSYRPLDRLQLRVDALLAQYGNDPTDTVSLGRDPLKDYNLRGKFNDYGHETLQGESAKLQSVHLSASYALAHNFWVDLRTVLRKETSPTNGHNTTMATVGIRWNFHQRDYLF